MGEKKKDLYLFNPNKIYIRINKTHKIGSRDLVKIKSSDRELFFLQKNTMTSFNFWKNRLLYIHSVYIFNVF